MNSNQVDSAFFKVLKFVLIVFSTCLGVLFAMFILVSFNFEPVAWFLDTIQGIFYKPTEALSEPEKKALQLLIESGMVLSSDSVITRVTGFYSTVITYLLGLIALISGMAFVYIKAQSYEKMEMMTEKKVSDHFKTTEFNSMLSKEATARYNSIKSTIDSEYQDTFNQIERLQKRIEILEGRNTEPTELQKK